ncbi:MAG: hypothetical protein HYT76_00895 [Deltaproteobacteria bacterium]|nr:hypothetical protein [Deltaproteobacteria bacterium]
MHKRFLVPKLILVLAVSAFLTGGACPSTEDSLVDDIKFALDQCNPSSKPETVDTFCNTAVTKGEELITKTPTDKNARLLLSSAYFGRSGLDFLSLLETFAGLADSGEKDFVEIRNAIVNIDVDIVDLRSSITTLTQIIADLDLKAEGNEDIFRQLGLMMALEAFVRPVKLAGTDAADVATGLSDGSGEGDVTKSDFVNADNYLADTNIDDEDILKPIRENYCRCSLQSGGFTARCLRDLMRCELNPAAADNEGDNGGLEADYDGTLPDDPNDVDCLKLLTPDGLSTCAGTDTK